jgi:phosphatidylglycerol:prolipoprotein diacylglycerol transferase
MGQAPGDNRAARRKAAAASRRAEGRSRRSPGSVPVATGGPAGAGAPEAARHSDVPRVVDPEALVVSHCFESGDGGEPYSATVRLTGRRVGIARPPGPRDAFEKEDRVDGIVPGSGLVSITSWVYGLEPGEWRVNAELVRPGGDAVRGRRVAAEAIAPAAWSWHRWALAPGARGSVRTRWAMLLPLARMPGVIPGSFTALGALGILAALVAHSAIVARPGFSVNGSLVVALIALAAGLVGAKVWYAVLHPGPWPRALLGGWAVDGFLVTASVVAVAALRAFDLPIGSHLDAAAPGLFLAVAIGRLGCFFTGCCAGRSTRSRWGVWSMDRETRIGARRIPTQLLESGAGLLIGVVAAVLVRSEAIRLPGVVFVAAVGAYLLVRQVLLRLRAERRDYLWRRSILVSGASS